MPKALALIGFLEGEDPGLTLVGGLAVAFGIFVGAGC
jgi:hypothetical protein